MRITRTLVSGVALAVLGGLTAAPPAQAARDDEVGALWPDTFEARQTAADCGRWRLDKNDFCVADDARNGLELGVRFRTSRTNQVFGLRFYRVDPAGMTASLWDSARNRLARQDIGPGPAHRWVDVHFPRPVTLEPGRTYTASYFTPGTKYAFRYDFFSQAHTVGPVTALQATPESPNGVFCYEIAACDSFPVRQFRSSSYWLTPLWRAVPGEPTSPPSSPPLTPPGKPGSEVKPGSPGDRLAPRVARKARLRVTFSEPVRRTSVNRRTVRLLRKGKAVKTRVVYDGRKRRVTLRPRKAARGVHRVVVTSGVRDRAGNRLDQNRRKPGRQRARWTVRLR